MPRNISTITCRIEIFPVLFSIDRESWSLTLNEPCNREGIAQKSSLQKSSTENSREFAQGNWPWSVRYRFEIDSVLFASKSDSWSHFSRSSYSLTFRRSLNFRDKLCQNSLNEKSWNCRRLISHAHRTITATTVTVLYSPSKAGCFRERRSERTV